MVARIKIKDSLNRSFFYNENKVSEGVAELILAENYPVNKDKMSQAQRLNVLKKLCSLRENLNANTVHISLNFDPSEQLSKDILQEIAKEYMDKIGFVNQPFLVYQHYDSGHPHIHILTTKVDWNGKAIDTNFIARKKSEPARKEIEKLFGLIKAEDSKKVIRQIKPAYVQKVDYGKSESKKAIANVLTEVINNYKFTSLPELNAVLNQFNVKADRGTENSRTFLNQGLHFKIINENGEAVGVPIKASLFAGKPTLKLLEEKFQSNEGLRLPHKSRIKNAIDFHFIKNLKTSIEGLKSSLAKDGIHLVARRNEKGILYGLTYVDHSTKCVFNGSALGKIYSANGINERLTGSANIASDKQNFVRSKDNVFTVKQDFAPDASKVGNTTDNNTQMDELMQAENANNFVPYEFSGKKKRRRRKSS